MMSGLIVIGSSNNRIRPMTSDEREQRYLDPEIDRTCAELTARHPAILAHERFIRNRLAVLAQRAYQHGQHEAYRQLVTTDEATDLLGITRRSVQALARRHDIGWRIGRDWLFRPEDIAALRERVGRVGRPPRDDEQ